MQSLLSNTLYNPPAFLPLFQTPQY
ncbi:hypothetical protein A2U01_0115441, partial [Trifolium medium]|nr:hypothetical protein [Trifolium medium]